MLPSYRLYKVEYMDDVRVLYIVKMIAAVIEYEMTIVHLNMM